MKAFVLLVCMIGWSQQADWTYRAEYKWPGVCSSGSQQSPINILTRDAVLDRHHAHIRGPLVFRGYQGITATALNNGHTLKWKKVPGTPAPVISGGPLRGNYSFLQFHLHWLSEHAIDGYKYPLEIHMVHVKTGLTMDEALTRADGLAVIGVLCVVDKNMTFGGNSVSSRYTYAGQLKSGEGSEHALAQIMPALPYLVHRGGNETLPEIIDLTRLLSPEPQSFYTYHGSLTTPHCEEVVTWIVMDKPLAISDNQYKQFSTIDIGETSYNYRGLHPTNRIVYRSVASCASITSPTFLGFLAALLSCVTSTLATAASKGFCMIMNVKRKFLDAAVTEKCVKMLN